MKKIMVILIFIPCFFLSVTCANNNAIHTAPSDPTPLLISTDVSIGLIDHHVGQGENLALIPGETDDGLTLALALNLQEENLINILGIIPIFGNATLPAEMLVAKHLVRQLKQNTDIPIVQGALAPVIQLIQDHPLWYNHEPISITDAFLSTCANLGVDKMEQILSQQTEPVTILALGPLTDVACLLGVYPASKPHIKEIIIIASQLEDQQIAINGKYVQDFNFNMDPLAGALLLTHAPTVNLTFMTFALTGQTSNKGRSIYFDGNTLKGPTQTTKNADQSLTWLRNTVKDRNTYWENKFGLKQGPFDQYALIQALYPTLFKCQSAHAHLGMENEISSKPWGQIKISLNTPMQSTLVDGALSFYRNIPEIIASKPAQVLACTDFLNERAYKTFKEILYNKTW